MNNLEKEIIFYFEKDKKISVTTYKTNEELTKDIGNSEWFANFDGKILSFINLKQVKFIEIKEKGE